jgi:hypothetical protein
MPLTRDAVLEAVATLGTTLAPWGLAFIRSYAVDKRLTVEDLGYERVDVIGGRRRAPRVSALLERGVPGVGMAPSCAPSSAWPPWRHP